MTCHGMRPTSSSQVSPPSTFPSLAFLSFFWGKAATFPGCPKRQTVSMRVRLFVGRASNVPDSVIVMCCWGVCRDEGGVRGGQEAPAHLQVPLHQPYPIREVRPLD